MSELQFLIDLLLNHKLSPATKKTISERIGAVEERYRTPLTYNTHATKPAPTAQSPSTQRILDEMAMGPVPTPAIVGQTPAAQAALQARQEAIRIATSGKEEKGRSSPRKF